jgi:hypothetical protein
LKIKGLMIKNPKIHKMAEYEGDFDDSGMNTYIPEEMLTKMKLKAGDPVVLEFKGNKVSTSIGPNGRIGLTRPELRKLGYMENQEAQ